MWTVLHWRTCIIKQNPCSSSPRMHGHGPGQLRQRHLALLRRVRRKSGTNITPPPHPPKKATNKRSYYFQVCGGVLAWLLGDDGRAGGNLLGQHQNVARRKTIVFLFLLFSAPFPSSCTPPSAAGRLGRPSATRSPPSIEESARPDRTPCCSPTAISATTLSVS